MFDYVSTHDVLIAGGFAAAMGIFCSILMAISMVGTTYLCRKQKEKTRNQKHI
jgi:prolipoprotein diacylglyceryltransferase